MRDREAHYIDHSRVYDLDSKYLGFRFGSWTVVEKTKPRGREYGFNCHCVCGRERFHTHAFLRRQKIQVCTCNHGKTKAFKFVKHSGRRQRICVQGGGPSGRPNFPWLFSRRPGQPAAEKQSSRAYTADNLRQMNLARKALK